MCGEIIIKMEEEDIKKILSKPIDSEENLEEDLLIHQPDGTRACINWELRDKGYHIVNQNSKKRELTNEELLKDAYKKLEEYQKRNR